MANIVYPPVTFPHCRDTTLNNKNTHKRGEEGNLYVCSDGTKHLKSLDTHMETDKIFQVVVFHLFYMYLILSCAVCIISVKQTTREEEYLSRFSFNKCLAAVSSHLLPVCRLCCCYSVCLSSLILCVCVGGVV